MKLCTLTPKGVESIALVRQGGTPRIFCFFSGDKDIELTVSEGEKQSEFYGNHCSSCEYHNPDDPDCDGGFSALSRGRCLRFEDINELADEADYEDEEDAEAHFYEDYCCDCEYRLQKELQCEGGLSVIRRGNCDKFTFSELFEQHEKVTHRTVPHLFIYDRSNSKLLAFFPEDFSKNQRLLVQDYRIGNVYGDGRICWGDDNDPPFGNARALYGFFWGSLFNSDLDGGTYAVEEFCPELPDREAQIEDLLDNESLVDLTRTLMEKTILAIDDASLVEGVYYDSDEGFASFIFLGKDGYFVVKDDRLFPIDLDTGIVGKELFPPHPEGEQLELDVA